MKRKLTEYEKTLLDNVTDLTNRSMSQTTLLLELCDYNFSKLCEVEEKLGNSFYGACPSTKDEVEKVLLLENKTNYWDYDKMSKRNKDKLVNANKKINELTDKLETSYKDSKELEEKKDKEILTLNKNIEKLVQKLKASAEYNISTRIEVGKTMRKNKEIETYIPQVDIGNGWKNVCSKHTVIYKETQDSINPVDQKDLAQCFLDSFVKELEKSLKILNKIK